MRKIVEIPWKSVKIQKTLISHFFKINSFPNFLFLPALKLKIHSNSALLTFFPQKIDNNPIFLTESFKRTKLRRTFGVKPKKKKEDPGGEVFIVKIFKKKAKKPSF